MHLPFTNRTLGAATSAIALYAACALAPAGLPAAEPAPSQAASQAASLFQKASWIWHATPESLCVFRKTFELAEAPSAAAILITADNGYELYVNGSFVGSDIGPESVIWQSIEHYNIQSLLKPGLNVIAVRASHFGGHSGLLAAARLEFNEKPPVEIVTDGSWRVTPNADPTGFAQADFNEASEWGAPKVHGVNGIAPWGKLAWPSRISPAHQTVGGRTAGFTQPAEDFSWPDGIIFLRGRLPETSDPKSEQAIWRINNSRAYLEIDILGPSMPGRALYAMTPARPGGTPRLLLEAGAGMIGSPSVSFEGETIYFSYVPAGEKFWRIYRIPSAGGTPVAITSGPFHDFDPEPLPDGRIVFSSTRLGSREEYHGNSSRSLFVMNADGTGIRPITQHIVGDMEPRVTASGNIVFIRQDNFMERAKVETHLHMIRPDGSAGQILLGPERDALAYDRANAAEQDGLWLRNYGFGSPAPLPDGRVACISSRGIVISGNEVMPPVSLRPALPVVDISPLPDGRLLCTTAGHSALGILDPANGEIVRLFSTPPYDLHSVVYLGERPRPPVVRDLVDPETDHASENTGFLICQNVLLTKQTNATLSRIKAVRVLEGRPFTLRSAKHQYDHIGVEAVELGTVPLPPDGSFFVEVPADRALALQAVDGEGRAIVNEISWIYVRPAERRSCIGCHSSRETAPPSQAGLFSLRSEPVRLLGQGNPHRFRGNNAANGGMLNLQMDRFREAASVDLYPEQRTAARGAGATDQAPQIPPGRPSEVRALIDQLTSSSTPPALRASAAQRLAIFRDRSSAPALASALRDPDPGVRMKSALGLAAGGGRDSVPALLEALSDSSPAAAQAADIALSTLTAHSIGFNAYAPPQERAEKISQWRAHAEQNWAAIESGLIKRLKTASERNGPLSSEQAAETEDVITALAHVGAGAGKGALREFIQADPGDHLRATLAALRGLGHLRDAEAVPLLERMLTNNLPKPPRPLAGNHEFGFTQRPVQLAGAAAEALGWIATPEAEAALLAACAHLVEFWYYTFQTADHDWLMGCHSSIPHFRIVEALDAIGTAQVAPLVPMFLRSIPIDPDRGLFFELDSYETVTARVVHRSGLGRKAIETALHALGDLEAKPASELLAAVTASPPAVTVLPFDAATRAAHLLSVLSWSPEDAPRIRAAFDRYRAEAPSRSRNWTCFYLARTLGKLGDPASLDSLLAALDGDPNEASFGRANPPSVYLFGAMSPYYRAAAAYSLGRIGDRRAIPSLIRAIEDFDNAMDVREAAAKALEMLANRSDLPQLEKLAKEYPEIVTRRTLLRTVEQLAVERDRRLVKELNRK
jgi:HEAT repeat protein